MPRTVRNWWIEASVDGRAERIAAGPRAKDGGFDLTVKQRDGGEIVTGLRIAGFAKDDGSLRLEVTAPKGLTVMNGAHGDVGYFETRR